MEVANAFAPGGQSLGNVHVFDVEPIYVGSDVLCQMMVVHVSEAGTDRTDMTAFAKRALTSLGIDIPDGFDPIVESWPLSRVAKKRAGAQPRTREPYDPKDHAYPPSWEEQSAPAPVTMPQDDVPGIPPMPVLPPPPPAAPEVAAAPRPFPRRESTPVSDFRAIDVEALAGSWTLASVREGFDVVHRVALPGGFGNEAIEANRDVLGEFDIETGEEPTWTAKDGIAFVFGTPPCSGWSVMNTSKNSNARGADSGIQQCTWGLVHYASRLTGRDGEPGPEVVSFECVQQAYTQGRDLMSAYLKTLRNATGQDYQLTHVMMSGASVGAAQLRKRYFWVAHRIPFGVDVTSPLRPATYRDAIYDLRNMKLTVNYQPIPNPPTPWLNVHGMRNGSGVDWHQTIVDETSATAMGLTLRILERANGTWLPGEYQKTVIERMYADGSLPEEAFKWINLETGRNKGWGGPRRVTWDVPAYVIHGGGPAQFIHPDEDRWLTIRELTRLMGYPDSWRYPPGASAGQIGAWIGKNCPVQSAQWMSHYVMASLNGEPGNLRARPDYRRDNEGTIDVTHAYRGPEKIVAEGA